MKPVRWRAQAKRDVAAAAAWYAGQGGLALELAFIDAVANTEKMLAEFPAIGSMRHAAWVDGLAGPLRFHPLPGFSRHLFYYIDLPTHIDVIRIWGATRGLQALLDSTIPDLD